MKRQRARLIVEVDLDPMPGWGNEVSDWQAHLQQDLNSRASHYNPVVRVAPDAVEQRNELSTLILDEFRPPQYGGSWRLNPGAAADAILAAGYGKLDKVRAYTDRLESMADAMMHVADRELIQAVITDLRRAIGDETAEITHTPEGKQ